MDENQNSPEGVRLVGRREAEVAIQSGKAISRDSLHQPPTQKATDKSPIVIGESADGAEDKALDLRDEVNLDDELPEEQMSLPDDEEDKPVEASNSGSLPHWTEPPTGEVPKALSDMDEAPENEEPTNKWSFTSLNEASGLADAPNNTDDFDSFDDDPFDVITPSPFRDENEAPAFGVTTNTETVIDDSVAHDDHTGGGETSSGNPHAPRVEILKSSSLAQRLGTGIVFAIVAAAAFAAGPKYILIMSTVAVLLAAIEYFDAVRRVGYRPPTALGLMSVAGAMLGVYARGEAAIPLVLALVLLFTFLWYLVGVTDESPTANTAITLLGIVWTGIFGSYAALLLREPNRHGVAFILGGVICVIAYDTAAYVGGTLIGRHVLAPKISPGKTWEGLACATVASVVVGGLIVQAIHPWDVPNGLALGLVVAVVAPIGDLAESMVKRDLGLKDMGRILPGHGGIFDRFDALLLILPTTYYLVRMLGLS